MFCLIFLSQICLSSLQHNLFETAYWDTLYKFKGKGFYIVFSNDDFTEYMQL